MLEYCTNKLNKIEKALEKKQYKMKINKTVIGIMLDVIQTYKEKAIESDNTENTEFYKDVAIQLNTIVERYFENLEE